MKVSRTEKPLSRSGQLREKRQQSVQPRTDNPAASNPDKAVKPSPVIMRNVDRQNRVRETSQGQPRRKVVYKVGADGVETRLPAIPIFRFSWQWISGLLAVLLFLFTIILINSPIFRVNSLEIQGLSRYSVDELQPLIAENSTSLFLLNTREILKTLNLTFPELIDPQIRIDMPNRVILSAVERQPIIEWVAQGSVYWIDAEGVVMQQRGSAENLIHVESEVIPPLSNLESKPFSIIDFARMVIERKTSEVNTEELVDHINSDVLKAIIDMNPIIPAGAALVYDPISGMGWRDPGGWEVYFGTDLTNIDFKQVEYQTILARLSEMGVTPTMISVEHVDSPYFRME